MVCLSNIEANYPSCQIDNLIKPSQPAWTIYIYRTLPNDDDDDDWIIMKTNFSLFIVHKSHIYISWIGCFLAFRFRVCSFHSLFSLALWFSSLIEFPCICLVDASPLVSSSFADNSTLLYIIVVWCVCWFRILNQCWHTVGWKHPFANPQTEAPPQPPRTQS